MMQTPSISFHVVVMQMSTVTRLTRVWMREQ